MLELLRRIVGKAPEPDPPIVPGYRQLLVPAKPRIPTYDSRLIDALKHDHAELVHLFEQIGRVAEQRRGHELPVMLVAFKTRLEGHLIAENVRFYNYVENSLQDDDEDLALIRSFRREMNTIARGVVDFVKKYQKGPFDDRMRQLFLIDYRVVGALLTQRIEREENSLYPLYQPM
jgi:hypothetical protein